MRLVEKCSCGASIELVWEEPKSSYSARDLFRASERAAKEAATFRKNHKSCKDGSVASRAGS